MVSLGLLDDPAYEPVHKPLNGAVPPVVAKWGKDSQLRWFRRFGRALKGAQDLSGYWCDSDLHQGPCCGSCYAEFEEGSGVARDGYCCCQDPRI